jgi:hypothetical protein
VTGYPPYRPDPERWPLPSPETSALADRPRAEPPSAPPSITCPRCGRTSQHPDDVREGYCGACHDWTSAP